MKTLKESLLSDIDTTIAQGDKWDKKFAPAQSELKYISDCINNFEPNNASASKWNFQKSENTTRATIFFRTSKLTKYFNLPGKHIFIAVSFNKYSQAWTVDIIFSNANKTIIDNRRHHVEYIGNMRGSISYRFEEKNIPNDKTSKFRMDEFIQKYVSHMFNDIESFKQYVVETYDKGIPPKQTI